MGKIFLRVQQAQNRYPTFKTPFLRYFWNKLITIHKIHKILGHYNFLFMRHTTFDLINLVYDE